MTCVCVTGLRRWLFAGLILAVLLAVLLYQLFAPGTALRYWRCSQDSIKDHDMSFIFTTNDLQVSHATRFAAPAIGNKRL